MARDLTVADRAPGGNISAADVGGDRAAGAIDLENGKTQMQREQHDGTAYVVILAAYPSMRMIHVSLDNARYHHARLVRDWLAQQGGRITLHFIPTYSPHLNPIERL